MISLKWVHLFFTHFLEYVHFFWMIMLMKKANNFQIAKVQPQGSVFLLDFLSGLAAFILNVFPSKVFAKFLQ